MKMSVNNGLGMMEIMDCCQVLANPFSCATVVVAEDYVDTFPHPQGLISCLQKLCIQLDVDIVSLERPVTVKGSWKTIVKMDAFLKTLISNLKSAISNGTMPTEEDFNAAFCHFEKENNYPTELHESPDQLKHHKPESHNDHDFTNWDSQYFDIAKFDEDDIDPIARDKWYFNANPRGKTVDKNNKRLSRLGKGPPEPYVIVEADDASSVNQLNYIEIEKALYQVYKKETIEKYKKKPFQCDAINVSEISEAKIKAEIAVSDVKYNKQGQMTKMKISPTKKSKKKSEGILINGTAEFFNGIRIYKKKHQIKESSESKKCVGNQQERRRGRKKNSREVKLTFEEDFSHSKERRHSARQKKPQRIYGNDEVVLSIKKNKEKYSKNKKLLSTNCEEKFRPSKKIGNKIAAWRNRKAMEDHTLECFENKKTKIMEEAKPNKSRARVDEKINCHDKQDTPNSRFECEQCIYVTPKETQLRAHKRRVHLTKSFKCPECEKEFGFPKDLRRHMKCHAKAENCCDVCGKMYKEERKLLEHKQIHATDYVKPEYPCKFCAKSFSTKYVLAYHIKSEHLGMKRSYICPTCGKSFSQRNSYLQHANVHLGIKPFTCEICGKRFSYEKSLKEHKFMHKEEKVFSCHVCKKSFRQASGLGIHMKVHKTTKDYVCSMCGKGFSQKQALERHERIHAGEKPYECELCKRTFTDSSVLRRHMILIHKKDPKQWRQDTLCHIPKKTDFFISVICDDDANSKTAETQHCDNREFQKQQPHHQHRHQQQEDQLPPQHGHLLNQHLQQPDNLDKQQQNEQPLLLQQLVHCGTNELTMTVSSGSSDSLSLVKEESATMNSKEPPEIVLEGFSDPDTPFAEVKPYDSYVPDRSFEVINSSLATSRNSHVETSVFSSLQVQNKTAPLVHMHNSFSLPTHCIESLNEQQPLLLSTHIAPPMTAPNTASFLPITYQQRSLNYDTSTIQSFELQPVQYSAMLSQQYPQTIVVLQDNLGTITYHQPAVSVSFSDDNAQQNIQLQHINQGPVSALSSSPLPITDLSQAITSGCDRDMSNYQLAHK